MVYEGLFGGVYRGLLPHVIFEPCENIIFGLLEIFKRGGSTQLLSLRTEMSAICDF